jgi:uncharacterized hydrophobic protein (TIGR00271 family)
MSDERVGSATTSNSIAVLLRRTPDADAVAAIEALVPQGSEFWSYIRKFGTLIVLSASIAAFGLLADSSAVVIGAMLVAPLMTPITAVAAATVTARNRRLVQGLVIIAAGMVGAIAVGWVTALIAGPEATVAQELPGEVLARTAPGLLDLAIAIAAGAAAGYISPRRTVISALPGVGIAVALVPPLTTVGITLQLGFGVQARNALLLYATNLAAIVFAASLMLLLTGFRPERSGGAGSLAARLVVTSSAVVLVAVPLAVHTRASLHEASVRRSVAQAVQDWDDASRIVELHTDVRGAVVVVTVVVAGPNDPRPAWRLAEEISDRTGEPIDLRLEYQRADAFEVSVR